MDFNAEDTSYYTQNQNQQNKSRRQVEDKHRHIDLGLENHSVNNSNSRTRTRTRNRTSSSSTRDNSHMSHTKMSNWVKKEMGNESSSNSISYASTYQTQHQYQHQNQNQRSSNAKEYKNSSSAGSLSLGSTLTHSQANATTENLIDADFSDHFVVPRKPLPENENGDSRQNRIQQQYQLQHQLNSENSKFQSEIANQVVDSDPIEDKIGKGVTSLSANVKKLLTPFQFGKRPKTSGVSPVLDGKRSHNAQGTYIPSSSSEFSHPLYMLSSSHASAATATMIPGRAHAFHDIDERLGLINNTGAVTVTRARAGSSKVTTERQVLSGTENGNINRLRNSISVLRPFTAGEVSIPSTTASASAASASSSFQEYEIENYGNNNNFSTKGVNLNSAGNSNPFGLDPQFYNRISTNNEESEGTFFSKPLPLSQSGETKGEGQGEGQGQTTECQGQVRRLPYGYYSKQYQQVVNKHSTENSLQSNSYLSQSQQNPYPSYNSARSTSKNQYSLRSQNQNQNQVQKVASRQNSNTLQLQQQSQIPKPRKQTGLVPVPVAVPFQAVRPQEKLLSKPNVYRNLSYSSNYTSMMAGTGAGAGTGTEAIPDVREPKIIGEFDSLNSTLPSSGTGTGAGTSGEPSFFSTSKSKSKSISKKCETETHGAGTPMVTTIRAAVAAKGDAPLNSAYFNLPGSSNRTGSGSESVVVEIPESLVPSNMATTSSLSYMRPKTVCENQVSYTQKLSMDSMIKQPSGRLGGCAALGMGPYFQQHQILSQNQRAGSGKTGHISGSTSAVLPHHENVMSSSVINATASGLVAGTGGSHSESQKLVSSQNFRNDLTSPLGPFHIPIRPFIIPQSATSTSTSLQGEDYEFELNNRGIAGGISSLLRDFNNNGNNMNYDYDCSHANNTSTNLNNLRHSIFQTCSQRNPIPVHLIFDYLVNTRKVGEGVYGEVFKAYFRGLPDQRVYKIVPIEGSKIVNGEKQKKFGEVEPEIIISQELNKLRCGQNGCYTDGHCRMLHTRICQGKYPAALIEQWKTWHRTYVSQNDLPEFESKQLYTIFEFEYHGTDIESFKFQNAKQSMAVLLHVIHALAAAEAGLEFEHRDLHWGNILVVKTRDPFTSYTVQGLNFRVPNCGLKSTIIDYTISRLTSTTGQVIFTDLADDEDQFCGSEDYQFEIYRMMREENKNDWSKFCPKTNIFWAHYLVGKLIDKGRYNDITSATHSLFKNKLLRIQSNLLKFQSCGECIRRYLPPFCRDLEAADI